MSVHKGNLASLKVQQNNGAYIHHEDGGDVNYNFIGIRPALWINFES